MGEELRGEELLTRSDTLDQIAKEMVPHRRGVAGLWWVAAGGWFTTAMTGEFSGDIGYGLLAAAGFALLAGLVSIPLWWKLKRLGHRRDALLHAGSEMGDGESGGP